MISLHPQIVSKYHFSKRHPRSLQQQVITCNSTPVKFIPYTPVNKTDSYELRLLQSHPVAITSYQRRDEGFLILGDYLTGENTLNTRCRETQPIVMTYYPDNTPKTMQVYIAVEDHQDQIPAPIDPSVKVDAAGGEIIAALRFEGNATQQACERARQQLITSLSRDGLRLSDADERGRFRVAQYGPVHSLSTRVNEVWLTIQI